MKPGKAFGGAMGCALGAILVAIPPAAAMPAGQAPATGCELHVWPTVALSANSAGSQMAGLLPALMAGDTTKQKSLLENILSPQGQIAQLGKLDMPKELGIDASTRVIFHGEEPFAYAKSRNIASDSACYS